MDRIDRLWADLLLKLYRENSLSESQHRDLVLEVASRTGSLVPPETPGLRPRVRCSIQRYGCERRSGVLSLGTATIDHWWPRSKGGPTEFWNLQVACGSCNASKGDELPISLSSLPMFTAPVTPRPTLGLAAMFDSLPPSLSPPPSRRSRNPYLSMFLLDDQPRLGGL